jgi:metallo-beta-lactamase family protein
MTTRGRAPTLTFLGAAGTVTGSRHLIETPSGARVLVDCGLFQGPKALRQRNWASMSLDGGQIAAASIDAVVLTHAHVDHCGAIPRLVREGFTGPVYATPGTVALARIVLPDSGHLHEEEAAYANRVGYSRHHPALPLYTEADAVASLERFVEVPFDRPYAVVPGVEVTWRHAGHILGAAWLDVMLHDPGRRIVFSGDLGRGTHPLLRPPAPISTAAGGRPVDVVVCESTYGDEEHPDDQVDQVLVEVVTEAARRGAAVLVPAFAVDRTEVVLHHLDRLVGSGAIPSVPVVVDSPMASAALGVYRHEAARGSTEFRREATEGRLFAHLDLRETRTPEESKELNEHHGPLVIVSASGMATGGRILHHLAVRMGDPRTTILLVGFQAPGTRGAARRAQAGAHPRGAPARDQGPAGPGRQPEREADLHPARGARAHRRPARGGRQAHPAAVGLRHVLGRNDDGTVDVFTGGRKMRCRAPRARPTTSSSGGRGRAQRVASTSCSPAARAAPARS